MTSEVRSARAQVTPKLRFEIFKRDRFLCTYCGAHPPEVMLEVDHIMPVAAGGSSNPDNLTTSCERCNNGKGANDLFAVPQSIDHQREKAIEREVQLLGYQEILEQRLKRLEEEAWRVARALEGDIDRFPHKGLILIKRWCEYLGVHAVLEAAERCHVKWPRSAEKRFSCLSHICSRTITLQEREQNGPR